MPASISASSQTSGGLFPSEARAFSACGGLQASRLAVEKFEDFPMTKLNVAQEPMKPAAAAPEATPKPHDPAVVVAPAHKPAPAGK